MTPLQFVCLQPACDFAVSDDTPSILPPVSLSLSSSSENCHSASLFAPQPRVLDPTYANVRLMALALLFLPLLLLHLLGQRAWKLVLKKPAPEFLLMPVPELLLASTLAMPLANEATQLLVARPQGGISVALGLVSTLTLLVYLSFAAYVVLAVARNMAPLGLVYRSTGGASIAGTDSSGAAGDDQRYHIGDALRGAIDGPPADVEAGAVPPGRATAASGPVAEATEHCGRSSLDDVSGATTDELRAGADMAVVVQTSTEDKARATAASTISPAAAGLMSHNSVKLGSSSGSTTMVLDGWQQFTPEAKMAARQEAGGEGLEGGEGAAAATAGWRCCAQCMAVQ